MHSHVSPDLPDSDLVLAPTTRNPIQKSLSRPERWAVLFGVCAGLSLRSGIPVILIRLGFVLLAFKAGIGLALYALLVARMPFEADSTR